MIPVQCDKCKITMIPLVPAMDLDKAEWYCSMCHLSKRMSRADAVSIVEARQMRIAQRTRQS